MSGPKQKLHDEEQEDQGSTTEGTFELELRDGRRIVVDEAKAEPVVEIRSEAGMLELRIRLTEQGPVLQMEAVRMQLKASEAVEIESPRVEIKGSEKVAVEGGAVTLEAEQDIKVDAEGDVRVIGRKIHLN